MSAPFSLLNENKSEAYYGLIHYSAARHHKNFETGRLHVAIEYTFKFVTARSVILLFEPNLEVMTLKFIVWVRVQ